MSSVVQGAFHSSLQACQLTTPPEHATILPLLSRALTQIRSTPPRVIASPATQPRRAAVALIIRVSPPPSFPIPSSSTNTPTADLAEFFQLDWVNAPGARPEILFLRRDKPDDDTDRASGASSLNEAHIAFPGGRTEDGDEGGLYTAMRQTWEEIGLDLAEPAYTPIGQLDDREITTSLGKRLLMILSPFVFLQLTPQTTPVDPAPGTTLHWVPLTELLPDILTAPPASDKKAHRSRARASRRPQWSKVTVDASTRLAPQHSPLIRLAVRMLVGNMTFPAIAIDPRTTVSLCALPGDARAVDEKRARVEDGAQGLRRQGSFKARGRACGELKLWGLSLGMTLDLLALMTPPVGHRVLMPPGVEETGVPVPVLAPSLTSLFPRFSYPDVNFWIWVFGKRYREIVRGWEASVRAGGANDRRINWTGSALNTFYAAVRKALVVVIIARALLILFGVIFGTWFVFFR
ncbi:hypothetical protein EIP86_003497 [Pleurotus ostreatoroseus]|nr:hypothetical protein EIP86_003497 [Pleurotus ostreatoroseus]